MQQREGIHYKDYELRTRKNEKFRRKNGLINNLDRIYGESYKRKRQSLHEHPLLQHTTARLNNMEKRKGTKDIVGKEHQEA